MTKHTNKHINTVVVKACPFFITDVTKKIDNGINANIMQIKEKHSHKFTDNKDNNKSNNNNTHNFTSGEYA